MSRKTKSLLAQQEASLKSYFADLLKQQAPTVAPPVAAPAPAPVDNTAALAVARSAARANAEAAIRQRGLNPVEYAPLIDAELSRLDVGVNAQSDPKTAFAANIADAVLGGEQNRQRQQFLQQADKTFGTDYGNKAITSSLLDDTISSILSEQRAGAEQYLERGKARGIINDIGYGAGRSAIDNSTSVGRSRLSSLAGDTLNKYRSEANTVRDQAYGAASGFQLGQNFSLDPYIQRGEEVRSRAANLADDDLRASLGGTNFFDLSSITQRAGQAQGAMNLRDADVATALRERRRTNSLGRGLGSQGAF
jgi:hypothetical protein